MSGTLMVALDEIPGDAGWWKSANRQAYRDAAVELLAAGLPEAKVVALLSRLYAAAADEFGN